MRAASHSACGADGCSPHGNSRKSQQDYKQRSMTITASQYSKEAMQFCRSKRQQAGLQSPPGFPAISLLLPQSPCSRLCSFFDKSAFYGRFLHVGLYFHCYLQWNCASQQFISCLSPTTHRCSSPSILPAPSRNSKQNGESR